MLKRHISVRLRLLSFLCILCASISLMPSVAFAEDVDQDPFSVLEADVTATPVPDLEEPAPMLRAAAAPIFTPYVSIFSYAETTLDSDAGWVTSSKFLSQPFYADICNIFSDKGCIQLARSVLFYDSYSVSDSDKYFRVHFTVENGSIVFRPYDVLANLYFVSDSDFAINCKMVLDPVSHDFYCNIPTDYLTSDGYFYLFVRGFFINDTLTFKLGDRVNNLSINDFIITTPVIPDDLSNKNLGEITYVDKSSCLPFPDSTPGTTDSPGGGTGGGGSTPATSDPALGEIKDSINSQKEQDQQQHEETKGLLGRIIDGITSIPGKIIELLTDALKALFIPSEDFLNTKLQSFQDDLDNMGFLAWPVSASIDFLELLLNASGSSGEITLPAAKFNMDGKTITIWEETTFNFAEIKTNVPVLFDTLNVLFGLLILVLVCQRAYNMWAKYFGQKPADVFSAIDFDDAAFNLEADRLDRQGYGL